LLLSQVYVPDPASVGQHLHDAAVEMVARGWKVRVLTSARGYDDPSVRYPKHETLDGVEIQRLGLSSFGKKFIALRVLAGVLFMTQTLLRGVFGRRPDMILVSTSPPMCSIAAAVIGTVRRVPIKYWVMDLNPDQMIELGRITERSIPARIFNAMNRMILKRARDVVALDRFMADRLNKKRDVSDKLEIMPPWPHDNHLDVVEHADNPFRKEHNLDGKFVVMYSGNHGFSTPVRTILDAALKMQDRTDLVFMFIGGGVGKKDVDDTIAQHKPSNIVSLPYQPIETLRYSLSAADVHLVSVGNDVVGVVHPCKIYGAMAVARPILLLGPDPCHVSDLVRENTIGWQISHGDVEGAIKTLDTIRQTPSDELRAMGARASNVIQTRLSKDILCGRFCDVLERGFESAPSATSPQQIAQEGS
jgi:putative colanic acid biosynthesis glycosyltransferase WcaI